MRLEKDTDQNPCSDQDMTDSVLPQLPDGIGLTLDQVREKIAIQHHMVVSLDDPILMLVTLLNAFLTEEDKLLDRHNKALSKVLLARTDGYIKAVGQATASIEKNLSSASLADITKIFVMHRQEMDRFRSNMIWLAAIAGTSALVNVAAFVVLALR